MATSRSSESAIRRAAPRLEVIRGLLSNRKAVHERLHNRAGKNEWSQDVLRFHRGVYFRDAGHIEIRASPPFPPIISTLTSAANTIVHISSAVLHLMVSLGVATDTFRRGRRNRFSLTTVPRRKMSFKSAGLAFRLAISLKPLGPQLRIALEQLLLVVD